VLLCHEIAIGIPQLSITKAKRMLSFRYSSRQFIWVRLKKSSKIKIPPPYLCRLFSIGSHVLALNENVIRDAGDNVSIRFLLYGVIRLFFTVRNTAQEEDSGGNGDAGCRI
jgi:hypothetical protein